MADRQRALNPGASRGERRLVLGAFLVVVTAVALEVWNDAQPHTNHILSFVILLALVAYAVLVMVKADD